MKPVLVLKLTQIEAAEVLALLTTTLAAVPDPSRIPFNTHLAALRRARNRLQREVVTS